ncbi:MAG: hypothetical protein BVN34_03740 [Proteobacteria bacterium ST_bin12]|nr:MAG: hypothetical protein BVN34_03740 [Proteobacteria bacterium ST_bin12]
MRFLKWFLRIIILIITAKLLLGGFIVAILSGNKWLALAYVVEFAIIEILTSYYLIYLPNLADKDIGKNNSAH